MICKKCEQDKDEKEFWDKKIKAGRKPEYEKYLICKDCLIGNVDKWTIYPKFINIMYKLNYPIFTEYFIDYLLRKGTVKTAIGCYIARMKLCSFMGYEFKDSKDIFDFQIYKFTEDAI